MAKEKEWEKQEGSIYWKPSEKGEELSGKVVDVIDGEFGKQYAIKKSDDVTVVTPSHKVLQNRMLKAEEGNEVRIVFLGTEQPSVKGRSPTSLYDVYLR